MRALVDGGADVRVGSRGGNTALMVAAGLGQPQGPERLPESRLLDAVKIALELGADPNAVNDAGQTAAHGAAAAGFSTIVKFLGEHGADLTIKDKRGLTPLDPPGRRGRGNR
jgi:ankyrin repeat protein